MWILHSAWHNFPAVPVVNTETIRVLFGIAVLWKFCWDLRWGGFHYFDRGSLTRWRYERIRRHAKLLLSPAAYKVFYVARMIAAMALFLGLWVPYAAAVVALWLAFEFTFDRKFHTQFMCVVALIITATPDTGSCFTVYSPFRDDWRDCIAPQSTSLPLVLGVLLMVQMYWSSVFHKLRSPQFLSGDVLQKTAEHYASIRDEMPYAEVTYPQWYYRYFALGQPESVRRRWRPFAVTTIGLELGIPVLLFIPQTWIFGAALGVLMHAGFAWLFPRRLLPYSLSSVACYLMFVDPTTLQHWLSGM